MKASELIALLQQVPADSEVHVGVGETYRGDGCQTGINYEVSILHFRDDEGNAYGHYLDISEICVDPDHEVVERRLVSGKYDWWSK